MKEIVEVVMAIVPAKKDHDTVWVAEIKKNGEAVARSTHQGDAGVKAVIEYDPEEDVIEGVVLRLTSTA